MSIRTAAAQPVEVAPLPPGVVASRQNASNLALIWRCGWTARRFAATR